MTQIQFFDFQQIPKNRIRYVTAAVRYQDKWVFSRHKLRTTWDMPGGHRETGETVPEAMARELWEETGALEAELHPLCVYEVNRDEDCGALFFGKISKMGPLPEAFEMEETRLSDSLPENLTYPEILPALFERVQSWLNLQCSPEELWDIYDENRCITGRQHRRGEPLQNGEYHLVVHVWIVNSRGQFLLTKRSPNKGFPNMWETTGGSALAGDDSLTAALREVKEETGLALKEENGHMVLSARKSDYFRDVWLFRQEFDLEEVTLQEGETTDKMYADKNLVLQLKQDGMLVPYDYLEEFFLETGH